MEQIKTAIITNDIYVIINWVKGISNHDKNGNCCPDLSCCNSNINSSQEIKLRYLKAFSINDYFTMGRIQAMFITEYYLPKHLVITEFDHKTLQ